MSEFLQLAYGAYNGCEKCGMFEMVFEWDCVCDLLIANGNCNTCMYISEYCICQNDNVDQDDGVFYNKNNFTYNDEDDYNEGKTDKEE